MFVPLLVYCIFFHTVTSSRNIRPLQGQRLWVLLALSCVQHIQAHSRLSINGQNQTQPSVLCPFTRRWARRHKGASRTQWTRCPAPTPGPAAGFCLPGARLLRYTCRTHPMFAYLIHVTLALDNYRLLWTHLTLLWKVQKQLPRAFLCAEDGSNQG